MDDPRVHAQGRRNTFWQMVEWGVRTICPADHENTIRLMRRDALVVSACETFALSDDTLNGILAVLIGSLWQAKNEAMGQLLKSVQSSTTGTPTVVVAPHIVDANLRVESGELVMRTTTQRVEESRQPLEPGVLTAPYYDELMTRYILGSGLPTMKAMAEQIRRDSGNMDDKFITVYPTTGKTADELRVELGLPPVSEAPKKYPGESNTFIPFENAEAAQALVDRLKAGEILWGPLIPVYHYDSKGTVMTTQPDPQSFSKSSDEPTIVEGK